MSGHRPWSEVRRSEPDDEFGLMVRETTAAAFGFWWEPGFGLHYHAEGAPRKITRRCLLCNPGRRRSVTPPLCIDGHEYHRRQQARKRRGR